MASYINKYSNIDEYRRHPLTKEMKMTKMSKAAKLLCDMSFAGAPVEDRQRVWDYMSILCDATKHHLDWIKATEDYGIAKFEETYLV